MIDSNEKVIQINTGTIVRFFLIIAILLLLYFVVDILLVVVAAVVIASAIEPVVRRIVRSTNMNRILAVVLVYVAIVAAASLVLIFFLPTIARDAIQFLNNLPSNISLNELWNPISNMGFNISSVSETISNHNISIADFINGLQSVIVGTSAGAFKTASVLFGGFFSFALIFVLSFYLSVQQDGVDNFLRIMAPVKHHEYIIGLWKRSQRKMALWLQGQVILGIIIGVLVYITLLIVGIKHALLLAFLAGIFEIIPIFGPIVAAIPAILFGFLDKGLGTGVLLIILYVVIQQLENHVVYPLVVKKVVGTSPIVVILAIVIGAKLAGLLGALVAVPLSAAFMEYISDIEKYKKAEIAARETLKAEKNL